MDLRVMEASDLDGAVRVWQVANIARGKPPGPERVARVVEKLQEPTAMPYVAASDAGIMGMALLGRAVPTMGREQSFPTRSISR